MTKPVAKPAAKTPDLAPVFAQLRALMLASAPRATLIRDDAGHIELAGPATDPVKGGLAWFGMVKTGARAVSVHLMPLYCTPALGASLSEAMQKRRQGKSCFNFPKSDPALFAELADLTQACAKEAS